MPGLPRGGSSEHQLLAQPLGSTGPAGAKGTHLCEALETGEPALPPPDPTHCPIHTHRGLKGEGQDQGRLNQGNGLGEAGGT